MGVTDKLLRWGWVDSRGSFLSWRHWQHRKHRIAVFYWRDRETGKLQPNYYIADHAMNHK